VIKTRKILEGIRNLKKTLEDLFRYTISGVGSVVVQFGFLIGFVEFIRMNETFASGLAFFIGCIVNYLMLYYWAFASKAEHPKIIFRYSVVMILTLGLNLTVFWVLNTPLNLWYLFSQTIATIIAAIANLILNRYYTFS
jgi:putative flippase GtrA